MLKPCSANRASNHILALQTKHFKQDISSYQPPWQVYPVTSCNNTLALSHREHISCRSLHYWNPCTGTFQGRKWESLRLKENQTILSCVSLDDITSTTEHPLGLYFNMHIGNTHLSASWHVTHAHIGSCTHWILKINSF